MFQNVKIQKLCYNSELIKIVKFWNGQQRNLFQNDIECKKLSTSKTKKKKSLRDQNIKLLGVTRMKIFHNNSKFENILNDP